MTTTCTNLALGRCIVAWGPISRKVPPECGSGATECTTTLAGVGVGATGGFDEADTATAAGLERFAEALDRQKATYAAIVPIDLRPIGTCARSKKFE